MQMAAILLASVALCGADEPMVDLVIYGGTSGGVIAAVQARKMGMSVIVVCPEKHLGGMSSGGLGYTDTGKKDAIGGLAREFYHRVWQHYQDDDAWRWQQRAQFGNKGQGTPAIDGANRTMWIFEPHVAEGVFEDLVREHQIPVRRDEWLDRSPGGVTRQGTRIQSFRTLSGNTYRGRYFLDATYEGDLLAAAGVSFHVGREANRVYGETWNGIQVGTLHHSHFFKNPVDPYRVPGDPKSGLLPRISDQPPGEKGEGDDRIQAYCYRMCLTDLPANRIPFPRPEGYDPAQYELLLRQFATGWREFLGKFDAIPNHKTDTNNHGPFSTDNIGYNDAYPEGSYEQRRAILAEHTQYQQGLMYFMANDPRVPEDVRTEISRWGLARDEFPDHGGWPHQIYVREARRMIGSYVMTELDCLDQRDTPESIGMGSYTMDSHNVQRHVTPEGHVQNEGDIGVPTPRPYEVALGAILPRRDECTNLLVPVCLSSSHIAYGSIRMEPVFMILGQSAATVASLALEGDHDVQEVPYEAVRARLLSDGQILELSDPGSLKAAALEGTVIDDDQAELAGAWSVGAALRPFVDRGYRHDNDANKGELSARFTAALAPGRYEVRLIYPPNPNRATNTPVVIVAGDGAHEIEVNQRAPLEEGAMSRSLGVFPFAEQGQIVITNANTNGHVIIDAVQFVPAE